MEKRIDIQCAVSIKNFLSKGKWLLVGAFIILSLLTTILYFWKRQPTSKPVSDDRPSLITESPTLPPKSLLRPISETKIQEMINKTIDFLQTQQLENGFYALSTDVGEGTPLVNAYTSAAYLELYQKTKKEDFLNKAKIELGYLLDYCQTNQEKCLWVMWSVSDIYKVTKEQLYLSFLKNAGEKLKAIVSDKPRLLGVEAKELVQICEITQDQSYCDEGVRRIEKARDFLLNSESSADVCFVTLAEAQAYKFYQDDLYLKKTKEFFREGSFDSLGKNFNSHQYIACLDTLGSIAQDTNLNEWRSLFDQKMEEFILRRWDKDKGAVYFLENIIENKEKNFYITIDSANFLRLLNLL